MNIVQRIELLFGRWGRRLAAAPHGRHTLLEHALRCADVAQSMRSDDALVAAALLHDLGRLLAIDLAAGDIARWPEIAAVRFLANDFGPEMLEPIRLQRTAWRCLMSAGPQAWPTFPHRPSVGLWGEALSPAACRRFASSPHGARALMLCGCILRAATPVGPPPPLRHFLDVLERALDTPPVLPHRFALDRMEHRLLCDGSTIPC